MKLILAKIGQDPTIGFAQQELFRYLKKIDPTLFLDCRTYAEKDDTLKNVLWIGLDGSVEASDRDEIRIEVANGAGIITGSNPRSVLIAVYRLLTALGCRFLFPTEDGDQIPSKKLSPEDINLSLQEKASYRHRTICIEGANGYEHIKNVIEWLPKVGMNGYFVQFQTPGTFFKRFYNFAYNPALTFDHVDDTDVDHIWSRLEEEIVLRGLDYHAVGHGWTCDPFGIPGSGWNENVVATDEIRPYLAEVNGKREFWGGVPLNTNLCYSQPIVRKKMIDAMVAHCQAHPSINYLHFWLADSSNSHCECAECRKKTPSDWYAQLLNELDEKLTVAGISTKIVCLIYLDLLWKPLEEKIKNPDRFVLMFAPITRTYSTSFADLDLEKETELAPFVLNKIKLPRDVESNVALLKGWQTEQLSGESFDFDYHLMWDHYRDPGYYACARTLHKDMVNLDKIGLDGMVSCQINRCFFPTGLPVYAMAKGLWDKTSKFEDICTDYFTSAYGDLGGKVEAFFSSLSELFDPRYARGELPLNPEKQTKDYLRIKEIIRHFRDEVVLPNLERGHLWQILEYYTQYCDVYTDTYLFHLAHPDQEERKQAHQKLKDLIYALEPKIPHLMDGYYQEGVTSALCKL